MSTATVVRRELRCAQKVTVRDPQEAFFTVGLPLLYLFIFATVFGSQTAQLRSQLGHRGHSSPSTRAADSRRSVPHCTRVTGSAVSSARACSTSIRAAVRARRWSGSQPLTARVAAVGVE